MTGYNSKKLLTQRTHVMSDMFKVDRFLIDMGVYKLSVISGFDAPNRPEVGLIVNDRCADVRRVDTLLDLFAVKQRIQDQDYSDFPRYQDELRQVSELTAQVYASGNNGD